MAWAWRFSPACCGFCWARAVCWRFRAACAALTYLGEVLGTSLLGGMLAYPLATLVMAKQAALFTYVLPFFVSTAGGTVLAAVLVFALQKTHALERFANERA